MAELENNPEEEKKDNAEVTPGENIKRWFRDFIDLKLGSDRAGAVESIVSGKQMRGSNAWMLVCSILIASLGLNLNSGAVIIGAMLISPLMNPILGIGLGVGTNDWPLLGQALKNFGIAMAIALVTSVVYFILTPIHTFTPEMQSRTEPTILDALVAVFGGLAGIISVTRKDKTNAIPGVAIATALMPPLCVAGYGIALAISEPAQGLEVFWRSFYLFFINSFFIAVTAYIIIRLLGFPYRKYLTKIEARRSMLIVLTISIFMIIPSVFILRNVLTRLQEEEAARLFTETYFPSSSSSYLLDRNDKNAPLLIYPIKSRLMSTDSIDHYTEILRAPPFNLRQARIVTDTSLTPSAMAGIHNKINSVMSQSARITNLEYRVQILATQVSEGSIFPNAITDSVEFARILKQTQLAFPQVSGLALSIGTAGVDSTSFQGELPLAIIDVERSGKRLPRMAARAEEEKLREFLQLTLQRDTLALFIREK